MLDRMIPQAVSSRLGQAGAPPPPEVTFRNKFDHVASVLSRVFVNLSEMERKMAGSQQGCGNVPEGVPVEESLAVLASRITNLAESAEQMSERLNNAL